MRIIIAATHQWNKIRADEFVNTHREYEVIIVTKKDELTEELLKYFKPDWIMFAHWSWILPASIYERYKCVVFHVSDVPNGRGGSPVQNQILDGLRMTKISAIAVDGGLDTGGVYLKKDLSLEGSAEEIFIRSSGIVLNEMIPYIIENNPLPAPQNEGGFIYRRRNPEQSILPKQGNLTNIFDYIRMLDAESYPNAFIEWGDYIIEFSRAKLCANSVLADVKIHNKSDDLKNML